MIKRTALLIKLESKPGKEKDVADFLVSGLPLVLDEPNTITWYAVQFGPSSFGIFDTFADDAGRVKHLAGKVAQALKIKAPELLAGEPDIIFTDILAVKSEDEFEIAVV
jgi:quinol monooxygenase YgiN